MKHSNFEIENLRQSTKNTAHFVSVSLSRSVTTKLMTGIVGIGLPLEEDMRMTLTTAKTQAGALEWFVNQSSGEWEHVLAATFAKLQDKSLITEIGFLPAAAFTGELTALEERSIAEALVDFAREYVAAEVLTQSFFTLRPPFACMAWLSRDSNVRRRRMSYLEQVWEALEAAEKTVSPDGYVEKHLRAMLWPANPISREWLLSALECKFQRFPHDVEEEMRAVARGFVHNQMVETLGGQMQAACASTSRGELCRSSKWHVLATAGLLEDSDRKPPEISPLTRAESTNVKLSNDLFDGTGGDRSVGENDLSKLFGPSAAFVGPKQYFKSSIATSALVHAKGDLSKLKTMFLSLLVPHGHLVFKRGAAPTNVKYALASTEYGVLCWHPSLKVVGGQRLMSFDRGLGEPKWSVLHIDSLADNWCVQEVVPLPPGMSKEIGPDGAPAGIACSILTDKAESLLRCAAMKGLRNMTKEYMTKLMHLLEVPVERFPQSEVDLAIALITFAIPGIDNDLLAAALDHRGSKAIKPRFDTALSKDTIMQAADLLEGEAQSAIDEVAEYAAAVDALKSTFIKPKAKKGPAPKKRKLAAKNLEALHLAQQYVPKQDGCSLSLETVWHARWKGSYPRPLPPYTHGQPFDPDSPESMRKALVLVLRWLWDEHEKATGNVCPWDLDGA